MIRSPGFLRGVDVETRPLSEVIGGIVGNAFAACAGIGRDDGNAMFGCVALDGGLGDEVLLGAGEA